MLKTPNSDTFEIRSKCGLKLLSSALPSMLSRTKKQAGRHRYAKPLFIFFLTTARESRFAIDTPEIVVHGSVLTGAFKVCTHFKNVYALHFTYRAHTFCIYINDLGTCVRCVRTWRPFPTCLRRFSKRAFYFLNRVLIWNTLHTQHTSLQPTCLLTFCPSEVRTQVRTQCAHMGV